MRFLLYNIAYATGTKGGLSALFTAHRYLRTPDSCLDHIIDFINEADADVVGLVEIDTGSFRTAFTDQTELVATRLKRHRLCAVKYRRHSIGRSIPILRKQANAFFSKKKALYHQEYYMPFGFKNLIIEMHLSGIRFFLVHLALKQETRKLQLDYLRKIAAMNPEPVIIGGDFNAFAGEEEVGNLMRTLDLVNPNGEGLPTFPAANPKMTLDFILCSKGIRIRNFQIPRVALSDHLPLILDFDYN